MNSIASLFAEWWVGYAVFGVTALLGSVLAVHNPEKRQHAVRVIYGIAFILLFVLGFLVTKAQHDASEAQAQEFTNNERNRTDTAVRNAVQNAVKPYQEKIDELNLTLSKQGRDVQLIRDSNIVTGRESVKVEVTNGQGSFSSLKVEDISVFTEIERSTHSDAPYAMKVTLQASAPINPVRFAIIFKDPLKYAELAYMEKDSLFSAPDSWIYDKDKRMLRISIDGAGKALLRPDAPLSFYVYSEYPLVITRAFRGPR